MVSRAIRKHNESPNREIHELIVHTGQHFDADMSQVFIDGLDVPTPAYNLGINGGSHGVMTGRMLESIEGVLNKENPDQVVVYGDTNSTLAGALAASKLQIPTAHIEAGLRSYNRTMPEEINRVATDHISEKLLCPTHTAVENLKREGITDGVVMTGDVMYDAILHYDHSAAHGNGTIEKLGLRRQQYVLATFHRAENTDNPDHLAEIAEALRELATLLPVIVPLHPRTRTTIKNKCPTVSLDGVTVISPVDYVEMLALERWARAIVTDSGGVQKEAHMYGVPCITLRHETEWTETVESGWNALVGPSACHIVKAFIECDEKTRPTMTGVYGDGTAAQQIVEELLV